MEKCLFSNSFSMYMLICFNVYISWFLFVFFAYLFSLSSQMHQGKWNHFAIKFYNFHSLIWIFSYESSNFFFNFSPIIKIKEVVNNNFNTLHFHLSLHFCFLWFHSQLSTSCFHMQYPLLCTILVLIYSFMNKIKWKRKYISLYSFAQLFCHL